MLKAFAGSVFKVRTVSYTLDLLLTHSFYFCFCWESGKLEGCPRSWDFKWRAASQRCFFSGSYSARKAEDQRES